MMIWWARWERGRRRYSRCSDFISSCSATRIPPNPLHPPHERWWNLPRSRAGRNRVRSVTPVPRAFISTGATDAPRLNTKRYATRVSHARGHLLPAGA